MNKLIIKIGIAHRANGRREITELRLLGEIPYSCDIDYAMQFKWTTAMSTSSRSDFKLSLGGIWLFNAVSDFKRRFRFQGRADTRWKRTFVTADKILFFVEYDSFLNLFLDIVCSLRKDKKE
jgi:hypothetical protein